MNFDWQQLFPASDFQFPMALRPGDGAAFFKHTVRNRELLDQRQKLLSESPELYAAISPDADDAWPETVQCIARWQAQPLQFKRPANPHELRASCIHFSGQWEPDWVLLRPDERGAYRVIGGAVCFASGWALPEKLNLPLEEVHSIVPGLNAALGAQIQRFLSKAQPGAAWSRENWGLSADTELNHHPSVDLNKLSAKATLADTWLRLERQFICKLPQTGAILFGIRVSHHVLAEIAKIPEAAERLARALETMPEPVALYKGASAARASLIEALHRVILNDTGR